MRLMIPIAATAMAAALAGCETRDALSRLGLDPDGLRCDLPQTGDRVHVEIRYATDGKPSAVPEECTVRPDTRITWRGPADGAAPFALRFPDGSPAGQGERAELRSSTDDGRQKIVLVAGNAEGRYKYDIIANGHVVDPAIIIER